MADPSTAYLTRIKQGSPHYDQAAQLRFDLFYREHHIPFESIFDPLENQDIHVAAITYTGDRVISYGRLAQNNPFEFQIHQMVVQPEYQGQGWGTQLLNRLIELAQQKGARIILLNARISKVGFYEKFGFKAVDDVFPSPSTGIPHIRMELIVHQ
ncbi:MAG: GNAT family N-acetyltransferase [Acaryochloridaceae cyanobacterium CSU_5_19]|nr:GNAT family N-acetyltransferase [Acaryochloridaceae cyanobacterium CSU_5_19]